MISAIPSSLKRGFFSLGKAALVILVGLLHLRAHAAEEEIALQNPTATFSQTLGGNFSAETMINGVANDNLGWGIYPEIRDQTAVFETKNDAGFATGTIFTFYVLFDVESALGTTGHTLGRFRLSVTTDPRNSFADGLQSGGDVTANWTVLDISAAVSGTGASLTVLPDKSVLAGGILEEHELYILSASTRLTGITGVRLEALTHSTLPHGGPGREPLNGNFHVSEFLVSARPGGAPTIATQPGSLTVNAGQSATFTVSASSALPVTYQWYRNGQPLPSATNSVLTISDARASDSGVYYAAIANGDGVALSNDAALDVRTTAPPGTIALAQPTATFSQTFADNFSVATMIDGVTTDNRGWGIYPEIRDQTAVFETVSDVGFPGGTLLTFSMLFHNRSVSSATSHTLGRFRLSVTTDPRSSFADGASSGGDVSANWTVLDVIAAGALSGATFTELSDHSLLLSGPLQETDVYTLTAATTLTGITGIRLEALSHSTLPHGGPGREPLNGNFHVTEFVVSARPPNPPQILQQPASLTVTAGQTATFSVSASSASPLWYQWFFNGTPISGANSATLVLTAVQASNAGTYHAEISNSDGAVVSDSASLTMLPAPPVQGSVVLQQATATFSQTQFGNFVASTMIDGVTQDNLGWGLYPQVGDQTAVFETVNDLGYPGGTILNFTLLFRAKSIPGTTGHTLGRFRLSVTTDPRDTFADGRQSNGDVSANWTVLDIISASAQSGATLSELPDNSLLASGPLREEDDYAISAMTRLRGITGIRIEALTHSSLPHGGPGREPVNGNFHVTEFLISAAPVLPAIIEHPASQTVRTGQPVKFTVRVEGEGSFQYQWYYNNIRVLGATGPSLEFPSVTKFTEGSYFVSVTDANGNTSRSDVGQLQVLTDTEPGEPPRITRQPVGVAGGEGETVRLEVEAAGAAPLMFRWHKEGSPPVGSNASLVIPSATPAHSGTYFAIVTNNFGAVTSAPVVVTVRAADRQPPIVTITSPSPGAVATDFLTLSARVTDNVAVSRVEFGLTGQFAREVALTNGAFSVPIRVFGTTNNTFFVRALDAEGNSAIQEVTVFLQTAREFSLNLPASAREGSRITIPLVYSGLPDVSGATLILLYPQEYFADPELVRASSQTGLLLTANTNTPGELRASFALAGTALPEGSFAQLSLRVRSVPGPVSADLAVNATGVFGLTGQPIIGGANTRGGSLQLTRRQVTGDNNANGTLDVGDASIMLRMITGLDPVRSWDIAANDLNGNSQLDAGDAIRVLRAVVQLDPQPALTQGTTLTRQAVDAAPELLTLSTDKQRVNIGDKVRVRVLAAASTALSGLSFSVDFQPDSLRLENAASIQLGSGIPHGALSVWNLEPAQNNFNIQNGTVHFGVSSASPWVNNSGAVAEFTFTVTEGALKRSRLPITLRGVRLTDGWGLKDGAETQLALSARDPIPTTFSSVSRLADGSFQLRATVEPGTRHAVETSTDLRSWKQLGIVDEIGGTLSFTDPASTMESRRFYRLKKTP